MWMGWRPVGRGVWGGERGTWRAASCRVTNLECPGNESRSPHMFVNGVSGHRSDKRMHKWNCFRRSSLQLEYHFSVQCFLHVDIARVRVWVIYRYNPKYLCPKLNGYGDKGQRIVWSFCGSTYCTWFTWRNTHTLRIVRPCLQLAQARSSLRLHM